MRIDVRKTNTCARRPDTYEGVGNALIAPDARQLLAAHGKMVGQRFGRLLGTPVVAKRQAEGRRSQRTEQQLCALEHTQTLHGGGRLASCRERVPHERVDRHAAHGQWFGHFAPEGSAVVIRADGQHRRSRTAMLE